MIYSVIAAVNAAAYDTLSSATGVVEPSVGENFSASVGVLLKGMLGIFVFMLMFYLLIYTLERVFKTKPDI